MADSSPPVASILRYFPVQTKRPQVIVSMKTPLRKGVSWTQHNIKKGLVVDEKNEQFETLAVLVNKCKNCKPFRHVEVLKLQSETNSTWMQFLERASEKLTAESGAHESMDPANVMDKLKLWHNKSEHHLGVPGTSCCNNRNILYWSSGDRNEGIQFLAIRLPASIMQDPTSAHAYVTTSPFVLNGTDHCNAKDFHHAKPVDMSQFSYLQNDDHKSFIDIQSTKSHQSLNTATRLTVSMERIRVKSFVMPQANEIETHILILPS